DVDARASLAGSWRTREHAATDDGLRSEYRRKAREDYRKAFELDPSDPYPLGNHLEYEAADHPGVDVVGYFRPALQSASRRCRAQVEVGVNLPWAFFDLGKFGLLLGEPYEALGWYARGVADSPAAFFVESALKSFTTLAASARPLAGLEWSRGFLRLAGALKF